MKQFRMIIISLWMLCILINGTAFGIQLTPENGIYIADPVIEHKIEENIHLESFSNESALDLGLFYVVMNSQGETAIWSKSSQENCYFIICVYSYDGHFKYGYKFNFNNLNCSTALFYDEYDNLCLQACYTTNDENGHIQFPPVVVTIDSEGINECYELSYNAWFTPPEFFEIDGIKVQISPESDYQIVRLEKAYLQTENRITGETYEIFNNVSEYENYRTKSRESYIILQVIGYGTIIAFSVFLLMIKHRGYEQTRIHKHK